MALYNIFISHAWKYTEHYEDYEDLILKKIENLKGSTY